MVTRKMVARLNFLLLVIRPKLQVPGNQCWGTVIFWCGSGSADPYL